MFLLSAHQTYLNNKLLKKRLSSKEFNNINGRLLESQTLNATSKNNSMNLHCSGGKILGLKLSSTITACNKWNPAEENQTKDIQLESRLMQRTKKYFSSNGHKFLFNNT